MLYMRLEVQLKILDCVLEGYDTVLSGGYPCFDGSFGYHNLQ